MGQIILSKEEYNNLRGEQIRYWDEEGTMVVAQFDANTPDGELFQRMEGCLLQFIPNEDKKSLSAIRDCQWCDKEIGCPGCGTIGYKKLSKIKFVDPIKFRDEDTYLTLVEWKNTIKRLAKNPIQSEYEKIIKINNGIQ